MCSNAAMIEARGHGPLLIEPFDVPGEDSPGAPLWAGTLVLDRMLVQPGETVHVTGGCARAAGACLLFASSQRQPRSAGVQHQAQNI